MGYLSGKVKEMGDLNSLIERLSASDNASTLLTRLQSSSVEIVPSLIEYNQFVREGRQKPDFVLVRVDKGRIVVYETNRAQPSWSPDEIGFPFRHVAVLDPVKSNPADEQRYNIIYFAPLQRQMENLV